MLFNSFTFIVFFVVVYSLYYLSRHSLKVQNTLLLIASYVFYGFWDWRFCFLMALSTLVDFFIGLKLETTTNPRQRKLLLCATVSFQLGLLGFFKYFNFFADSAVWMLNAVGLTADPITLNIILPIGISFYTFQTLSYTIDVYRHRLEPTHSLLEFAVFVSFFPHLVAGPILRARDILPQAARLRRITPEQVSTGLSLILWGYFQKIVVADNLAVVANAVFDNYTTHQGLDLGLGTLAFAGQILCDFSGYSDIARGLGKLMGFEMMLNFKLPYFALDPSDFWLRWHISLSSWLRDYLYISLGGNRRGRIRTYCNLMSTMLLGGLWHGAAWHFVLWGAYHGALLIGYRLTFGDRPAGQLETRRFVMPLTLLRMGIMFGFTLIGWVIFRARSVEQIGYMLTHFGFAMSSQTKHYGFIVAFYGFPILLAELWQYFSGDLLIITRLQTIPRAAAYALVVVWILIFAMRQSQEFIYFQF